MFLQLYIISVGMAIFEVNSSSNNQSHIPKVLKIWQSRSFGCCFHKSWFGVSLRSEVINLDIHEIMMLYCMSVCP